MKNLITPRNISLISFGAFTWAIFSLIQGQFLNEYVATLPNYKPLVISLMVSLGAITGAVASIIAGIMSDNLQSKLGRRKPFIIVGGVISAVIFLFIPLIQAIALIIAFNVVMNLFNSAAFVCNNSLIPDIASEDKLGKLNAFASIGSSIGTIAGFAIMLLNTSMIFYATGAVCSLGFLILGLFIQEPKREPLIQEKHSLATVIASFRLTIITKEKAFLKFFLSHFLLHVGINTYLPFLLIFLKGRSGGQNPEPIGLGLSSQEILLVFTIMTIISLLSTLPAGFLVDKTDNYLFLLISRVLLAITTACFALAPVITQISPVLIAIILIIPYGLFNTADTIARGVLMHHLAPEAKRGQFLAFVLFLAQLPGVIIGGLIAQFLHQGYSYLFLAGAIIILLSLPFVYLAKISQDQSGNQSPYSKQEDLKEITGTSSSSSSS
ncbi:MAG: MFS transporter [Candidatus Heimdallarchaeota archaeon]|nr:MFS transporter [Candidatus Heimdallarchaeota archaeon]